MHMGPPEYCQLARPSNPTEVADLAQEPRDWDPLTVFRITCYTVARTKK